MRPVLETLLAGHPMPAQATADLYTAMLDGRLSEIETAAVLAAWRMRGEGAEELYWGAVALRQRAITLTIPGSSRPLVDNCGTGGDGSNSFNLSTAAAIVAAAAGAHVAKHGNRSVSSKCGSADLLFAAGLPSNLSPEAAASLLEKTGFTFFFAPNFHPALARLAPVRRQLGVRTVFNLLGPLANPIAPEYQLIGVGSASYLEPMAAALGRLGGQKALVVHGRDGLDEISPNAPTDARFVQGGQITPLVIEPSALGIASLAGALDGGDAAFNLKLLWHILDDEALASTAAERAKVAALADAVALNAGAVLWLAGLSGTLEAGVALARATISSKVAREFLRAWLLAARPLA